MIAEDGCAVIDRLAPGDLLDRVEEEMAAYVDATPYGTDDFAGPRTRRTGGLVARSAARASSCSTTSCSAPATACSSTCSSTSST